MQSTRVDCNYRRLAPEGDGIKQTTGLLCPTQDPAVAKLNQVILDSLGLPTP
jgi:hypothetical protein